MIPSASGSLVLEYGRPRRISVGDCLSVVRRLAGVGGMSIVIGLLLGWLFIPLHYVDGFRFVSLASPAAPTTAARSNGLSTFEPQIESPGFINAAAAKLLANGTMTARDLKTAEVHVDVDYWSEVVVVSVSHLDPFKAELLTTALMSATNEIAVPGTQGVKVVQFPLPGRLLDPHYPASSGWTLIGLCAISAVALCLHFRTRIFTISPYVSS